MKKLLFAIVLLFSFLNASNIKVLGTSTLHDWEINVEKMVVKKDGGKLKSIYIKVEDMHATEGSVMDDHTRDAMEADKYKDIKFTVTSMDDKVVKGTLKIHGKSQNITAHYTMKGGKISGDLKLKMTSFGIKPPEFMFGTMSTGDEVKIHFAI